MKRLLDIIFVMVCFRSWPAWRISKEQDLLINRYIDSFHFEEPEYTRKICSLSTIDSKEIWISNSPYACGCRVYDEKEKNKECCSEICEFPFRRTQYRLGRIAYLLNEKEVPYEELKFAYLFLHGETEYKIPGFVDWVWRKMYIFERNQKQKKLFTDN